MAMDDFKYRIRDGKVVLHDKIHPSFTDMDHEGKDDLFKLVTVDLTDDILNLKGSQKRPVKINTIILD